MSLPIVCRPATEADLPFFFSSTLQSHYYSSSTNRHILPSVYYPQHKTVLEQLLRRPQIMLVIAALADSPEVIVGYALAEGSGTLHYVYVKKAFRRFGMAKSLMEALRVDFNDLDVTHWTADASEIWRTKRWPNVRFNPYLLMEQANHERAERLSPPVLPVGPPATAPSVYR